MIIATRGGVRFYRSVNFSGVELRTGVSII